MIAVCSEVSRCVLRVVSFVLRILCGLGERSCFKPSVDASGGGSGFTKVAGWVVDWFDFQLHESIFCTKL
jgi:hypothetical protein